MTAEEYWSGPGLRFALSILAAGRIMEYLNDNDPTTNYPTEQYESFNALGTALMAEWMLDNPDIVVEFGLDAFMD